MARARNIKPGFFKNEDLAECTPWTRLCFAGLWTLADREGRLENRPKRIKGELFALDSIEVEPLLNELEQYGFIFRYTAQSKAYIQILAFHKHQAPHHREAKSIIPSPQSLGLSPHGMDTKPEALPSSDEDETQGEAEALDPKEREARGQNPSDSLIPDSLNLIPDSLQDIPVAGKPSPPPCPHQEIIDAYHALCPTMAKVKIFTDARRKALQSRWRESPKHQTLEFWRGYFAYAASCPLLRGDKGDWRADFEWLVTAGSFAKVVEGKYEDRSATG